MSNIMSHTIENLKLNAPHISFEIDRADQIGCAITLTNSTITVNRYTLQIRCIFNYPKRIIERETEKQQILPQRQKREAKNGAVTKVVIGNNPVNNNKNTAIADSSLTTTDDDDVIEDYSEDDDDDDDVGEVDENGNSNSSEDYFRSYGQECNSTNTCHYPLTCEYESGSKKKYCMCDEG